MKTQTAAQNVTPKVKHTPVPWKIEGHVDRMIIKAKNYTVCEMRTGSLLPNGDDAAFIVRAVNVFDTTMALARFVIANNNSVRACGESLTTNEKTMESLALDAVAKAEGR